MSLSKEELVLAACLLETTDASLSAEDAMSDVKQIMMNLPESLDPAYRGLLAKAACILLSSNRFSPGAAIAEARKVMTLAGFGYILIHAFLPYQGGGSLEASISPDPTAIRERADASGKGHLGIRGAQEHRTLRA